MSGLGQLVRSPQKMCHFLTISVPAQNVPEVPDLFRRKIHFSEQMNRSVTSHTPSAWTSFTATSGGCSCDFYRASKDTKEDESKLIKKYRKKGWSEAKIERAIESRPASATRSAGLRDDIRDLISELTREFGELRLSLHWYSGDTETEGFTLSDAGSLSVEDFRRDTTMLKDETTLTLKLGEQGAAPNP